MRAARGSIGSRPGEDRYKANLPFRPPALSDREKRGQRMRYYIGVDWADAAHAIWVEGAQGGQVVTRTIPHTAEGFAEWPLARRAAGAGRGTLGRHRAA